MANIHDSSESITYFNMIYILPLLAAKASWTAMHSGIPFGGTIGAIMMSIMSNDSGEYPFAPLISAALALPIAFICDILLYIPCIIMRKLNPQGFPEPMVEPLAEPMVKPLAEPMVKPLVEPMVKPLAEPIVKPFDVSIDTKKE